MRIITGIILASFLMAAPAMATDLYHCAVGMYGESYCSKDVHGSAARDTYGSVFCGRGDCMVNQSDVIMCSSISGGGASRDINGTVSCQGGCEQGSKSMCDLAE